MNINFHYYTVKAAAIRAGFNDADAQIIASYSQFVDDYATYNPMHLKEVPVFAQHLATKNDHGWLFKPVTTGFETLWETTRLLEPENQQNILIPFHFMPAQKLNSKVKSRKNWRVKPGKLEDDSEPSLIHDLLMDAKQKYQKNTEDTSNLIRIGILLHIFADTYAHQGFSGFNSWENHAKLIEVKDNNNKDITHSYHPKFFLIAPSLGHANVGHAVDTTHISFKMKQKTWTFNLKYSETSFRNNTEEFLTTTHEIINYLRSCLEKKPLNADKWDLLDNKFRQAFLPTKQELKVHWKNIFPDTTFYYDEKDLFKVNDNFFSYNVIANEIRQYVQGKKEM